jgi:hypothetical protein
VRSRKHEKGEGIPTVSTVRRMDPPAQPRKKAGSRRKEYPSRWKVSLHNFGYVLSAHRGPCKIKPYWCWDGTKRNRFDLPALLTWAANEYPETASLPVRFINCQPIECGREVIPN